MRVKKKNITILKIQSLSNALLLKICKFSVNFLKVFTAFSILQNIFCQQNFIMHSIFHIFTKIFYYTKNT